MEIDGLMCNMQMTGCVILLLHTRIEQFDAARANTALRKLQETYDLKHSQRFHPVFYSCSLHEIVMMPVSHKKDLGIFKC